MPSAPIELNYARSPALVPSYARALLEALGRQPQAPDPMPTLVAHLAERIAKRSHISRYRRVCGFEPQRHLPITYPHVLAFPLHMALMTNKKFPFKIMGLIHVRNIIHQYREIAAEQPLGLTVGVSSTRPVRHGLAFDLITDVRDADGQLVWQENATMLARQRQRTRGRTGDNKPASAAPAAAFTHQQRLPIAADIGRRYAFVAGDFNPIHLGAHTARLFGFRRAIATGMWLKARVAAELMPQLSSSACTLRVEFKKPVFLPAVTSLGYDLAPVGAGFALANPDGNTIFLQGDVSYI